MHDDKIVLFDGVCNLCSGSVQFIIKRDPGGTLRFASLQSPFGRETCLRHGIDPDDPSTMVYLHNGHAYIESDAVLHIARELAGPLRLAGAFLIIVPGFIRDALYRFMAMNRYKWFGKKKSCWLPSPKIEARFLDAGSRTGGEQP